jgi:hypothetical protein
MGQILDELALAGVMEMTADFETEGEISKT